MKIEIGAEIGGGRDQEIDDIVTTIVGTMTDSAIADLVLFSNVEVRILVHAPLLEEARRREGLQLPAVLIQSMINSTTQINQKQMKLEET